MTAAVVSAALLLLWSLCLTPLSQAFVSTTRTTTTSSSALFSGPDNAESPLSQKNRRDALGQMLTTVAGSASLTTPAWADDEEDSFASIAARASQISKDLNKEAVQNAIANPSTDKTMYDFTLPMEGQNLAMKDVIRQGIAPDGDARVKALVVVNMKQDDPIARTAIPELITLASKYGGRSGVNSLAIIACPSDQGYFEPDTSQLIRLKLASEYGYGINPSTIVTDKVNYLGTGAHPFWRWLQANCRTPAGLGRVEGNFEKFLLDARTGLPLRRYPRKYKPLNMADDIEAILAGRPLPPPQANWQEEWRSAAVESERDTYRFQKGLNYFDQAQYLQQPGDTSGGK